MDTENLTFRNFFSNYIIHPRSEKLSPKDRRKATIGCIAAGLLIGIPHIIAKCRQKKAEEPAEKNLNNSPERRNRIDAKVQAVRENAPKREKKRGNAKNLFDYSKPPAPSSEVTPDNGSDSDTESTYEDDSAEHHFDAEVPPSSLLEKAVPKKGEVQFQDKGLVKEKSEKKPNFFATLANRVAKRRAAISDSEDESDEEAKDNPEPMFSIELEKSSHESPIPQRSALKKKKKANPILQVTSVSDGVTSPRQLRHVEPKKPKKPPSSEAAFLASPVYKKVATIDTIRASFSEDDSTWSS